MTKAQRERAKANLRGLERQLAIVHDADSPLWRRKRASRLAARLAERLGILVRPRRCEWCGRRLNLERHHFDHFEPLAVTWLCGGSGGCHEIADGMAFNRASATSA